MGHRPTTGPATKADGLMGGSTIMPPRLDKLNSPNRICPSHELRDPQVP